MIYIIVFNSKKKMNSHSHSHSLSHTLSEPLLSSVYDDFKERKQSGKKKLTR